jgi:hypothetical protein
MTTLEQDEREYEAKLATLPALIDEGMLAIQPMTLMAKLPLPECASVFWTANRRSEERTHD